MTSLLLFQLALSTWVSIPGSEMNQIYDPAIEGVVVGGRNSFEAVQDAWSGAACVGDELFLLGGGHGDGANNAVYAVNVLTGTWRRVGPNPTTSVYYNVKSQTNPDGSIAARHSYDLMVSDGVVIYVVGGAVWNEGTPDRVVAPSEPPPSGAERSAWKLDLVTETWSNFGASVRPNVHGAMEIANGKLYAIGGQGAQTYDFLTNSWTAHYRGNDYHAGTVLVYSPDSGRLYGLGNTFSWYRTTEQFGTTVRTNIPYEPASLGKYWGNTYYPPERRVLLWNGGPEILSYSEITESWSIITPQGNPGAKLKNGALGRFSYCGGRVVLVNGIYSNLWYLEN